MCLAHQFLQCFVEFARSSHRTRMSADKPRKSSHCALQNRGRERPPNPKSSPSDPGRAKKRVRSAPGASKNFFVRANEGTSSEKARPEPPKSARPPRPPRRFSVISRWIFRELLVRFDGSNIFHQTACVAAIFWSEFRQSSSHPRDFSVV